jgi:hypothetical protein
MSGALCRPESFPIRRVLRCPTENRRRRMAGHLALWYGATITCLGCGDSWTDGEMHPRPFRPRWREDAIARGRKAWDEGAGLTRADERSWIRDQLKRDNPSD